MINKISRGFIYLISIAAISLSVTGIYLVITDYDSLVTSNNKVSSIINTIFFSEMNFFILLGLMLVIFIYEIAYGTFINKNKSEVKEQTVTEVLHEKVNEDVELSEVDIISLELLKESKIEFTKDSFNENQNNLTFDEIIEEIKKHEGIEIVPGVGRRPISIKLVKGKSFLMVQDFEDHVNIKFKCGPTVIKEITKIANDKIEKSTFPHGFLWQSLIDSKYVSKETLQLFIKISYELTVKQPVEMSSDKK